jgi:hypothetical protein
MWPSPYHFLESEYNTPTPTSLGAARENMAIGAAQCAVVEENSSEKLADFAAILVLQAIY